MPRKTSNKTPKTKFEQTHIHMVVDRSGSMQSCAAATVAAINRYLGAAREDANLKEADFELAIFDDKSIDTIRDGAPLKLDNLAMHEFNPRGMTPLYDAVGRGIDKLDEKLAKAKTGKAILVIATDGHENASRKYSHTSLQEVLKARQAAGWLVVFLGAGLEAAKQGLALGISSGTVASFDTSAATMDFMSCELGNISRSYGATPTAGAAKMFMASGKADFSVSARKGMGDTTGGSGLTGAIGGNLLKVDATKTPPNWTLQPGPNATAPTGVSVPKANTQDVYEKGASNDAWGK